MKRAVGRGDQGEKVERWEGWALAAILLLALIARIIGLNAGLWYDEIFTLTHYVRAPLGQVLSDFSSLNNHMFYSLQAKAAVPMLGESAWTLRLPAMLFGLASLAALWAIARGPSGRLPTLFALLLLAISYHHVWFSQNARGYTGLLFWTSLATLFLIEGLKRPDWRICTGYGLSVAAFVGLFFLFFPRQLLAIFGMRDPIVVDVGVQLLRVLSVSGLFITVALAYTGGLQGTGDTKSPL